MSTADPDLPPEPPDSGRGRPGEREDDGGLDVESAFADIVAHWDAVGPPVGWWPVQEDVDVADTGEQGLPHEAGAEPRAHDTGSDTGRQAHPRTPSPAVPTVATPGVQAPPARAGDAHRAGDADRSDDTDRWSPPELPPITRAGWRSVAPWVAVLGAPAFFLVVVLANLHLPGLALVAAVVVFMAGFVTLVLRLPARRDDDSDGAVL